MKKFFNEFKQFIAKGNVLDLAVAVVIGNAFNKIVTSDGVKYGVTKKINDLFYDRIPRNKEYYKNNELLQSVYYYFDCIIKKYYVI